MAGEPAPALKNLITLNNIGKCLYASMGTIHACTLYSATDIQVSQIKVLQPQQPCTATMTEMELNKSKLEVSMTLRVVVG